MGMCKKTVLFLSLLPNAAVIEAAVGALSPVVRSDVSDRISLRIVAQVEIELAGRAGEPEQPAGNGNLELIARVSIG